MVTQTEVLAEVRAHPEGITTPELAEIFLKKDSRLSYYSMRAKMNQRCRRLEKHGDVYHIEVPHHTSKWFPVEAAE